MSAPAPISLPDEFNAASYFVDRHIAEGRDNKIAIECGDTQVTYRRLFERVNQVGNGLRKLGVRIEERVLLLLLDTPEFAASFFGAIKIGAVPVPVNTLLKATDYEYLLNNSRARVAIVDDLLFSSIQAIPLNRLRYLETIVLVGGHSRSSSLAFTDLTQNSSPALEPHLTSKDDAAFWLYSSGSTGQPKACVHLQHDMVVSTERYAKAILKITDKDRCFSVAKLFFAYGLGNGLYFPLAVGATSILLPRGAKTPQRVRNHRTPSSDSVLLGSLELCQAARVPCPGRTSIRPLVCATCDFCGRSVTSHCFPSLQRALRSGNPGCTRFHRGTAHDDFQYSRRGEARLQWEDHSRVRGPDRGRQQPTRCPRRDWQSAREGRLHLCLLLEPARKN